MAAAAQAHDLERSAICDQLGGNLLAAEDHGLHVATLREAVDEHPAIEARPALPHTREAEQVHGDPHAAADRWSFGGDGFFAHAARRRRAPRIPRTGAGSTGLRPSPPRPRDARPSAK